MAKIFAPASELLAGVGYLALASHHQAGGLRARDCARQHVDIFTGFMTHQRLGHASH